MAERELRIVIRVQGKDEIETLRSLGYEVSSLDTASRESSRGVVELGRNVSRLGVSAFIAYDRFAISQNAVENAQIRQQLSTMRLQNAIEKYGAGSKEVVLAQQELDISTRSVEIAQQRMWVRMAFGIGIVIPEMIAGIKGVVKALGALHITNIFTTASTQALTRAQLAARAATLVGIPLAIAGAAAAAIYDPSLLGFLGGGPPQGQQVTVRPQGLPPPIPIETNVGPQGVPPPTPMETNVRPQGASTPTSMETNMNFYGTNMTINGVQTPIDFARKVNSKIQTETNRSSRP